jgi:phenylacetate-CoA ligase
MSSIYDRIYTSSPTWLQNVGLSAYGYVWKHRRFGGCFQDELTAYQARELFSGDDWKAYQTSQLRKLLLHASQNVPYYQRALSILTHEKISDFTKEDLLDLPLLEKENLRSEPLAFIARGTDLRRLHPYHTSGTTGTPVAIQFTNDMHRTWSAAYEARVRRWAGIDRHMSRAMIGGRLVVPKASSTPPFWRYNRAERQLYMSAFHISLQNAIHYVEALNTYKPDYLVGYASSHYFLARMILEQKLQVGQPKAILTSSEKLTPEMRSVLEAAYHCQVYDAYSGVEACCLASECEYHRLHISPDVGIIEILDENGQPAAPGVPGEIVATGLLNIEQPLIRYRTGDLADWSDQPCPCGRHMPVIEELVGRLEDIVLGRDGREMVRFHGIFVALPHVREGQIIQETLTQFRLRLVVEPSFGEDDRNTIQARFNQRLGPVEIAYEFVDQIERTARGKFKAVISKVKRNPAH